MYTVKPDFHFMIYGKPIGKARPRFVARGQKRWTINPQETEEGLFAAKVSEQYGRNEPTILPVMTRVIFTFERPKNHFGTGRNSKKLKPSAPPEHIVKPDVDNLEKFVFDCFNGVVWKDDSQVVKTMIEKRYGDIASTEVSVYILE